jgi:hypothetical protein
MNKGLLNLISIACLMLIVLMPASVFSRGVTSYLPLNMSPEIERQIERVLILAEKPVMTRPIAVATVQDALPDACKVDEALCKKVERYIERFTKKAALTHLRAEVAADTGDSDQVLPNQHGKRSDSSWQLSAEAYYQPAEYFLINLGGIAYEGHATPTGSMLSAGIDYAQLDIGYRDHWLSPFTDSSMLISTEAPTMPSITLSNYRPITGLGFSYQLYLAEMSRSSHIAFKNRYTTGNPRLAGVHLQIEPVTGYAFSVNRQSQFGGGERDNDSFSDYINASWKSSGYDDTGDDQEFGNHQASITSRILFPGKLPLSVYFEYAGEDYSRSRSFHLGSSSFSLGIDVPRLWDRFDVTYEMTEWQNDWYVHHVYQDGLTNLGEVIGHWFGDRREFDDDAGGMSHMLRLGWQTGDDGYLQTVYRTLKNDSYTSISYKRVHELGINYSRPWHGHTIGAGLYSGSDVYGEWYARLSASMDLSQGWWGGSEENISTDAAQDDETEFLIDMGVNYSKLNSDARNPDGSFKYRDIKDSSVHLGIGALRAVSENGDLGVRIEWDRIEEYNLYSVRILDYRYRIGQHFALNGFFGVGRYELETPAYGYYLGVGSALLDIISKWDLCIDVRKHEQMSRTKTIASETPNPRLFYGMRSATVYLSRRF